jgi:arabinose-5-phosphate isomerase
MRPLSQCRVAKATQTVREILVTTSKPGRRTGAVMLVAEDGALEGLFTDSDLARLLETCDLQALEHPVSEYMVRNPTTITTGSRMSEAVSVLANRKFSELPVVDEEGKAVGLVDVTDVVAREVGDVETAVFKRPTKPAVRIFPGEDVFAAG